MSQEKKCLVCGKPYKYCMHCNKNAVKEMWKNTYCSSNCRDVFNTCSNFEGSILSQKDAYNVLKKLDVTNVTKAVKASVDKIMEYKPKTQTKNETSDGTTYTKPRRKRIQKVEESE